MKSYLEKVKKELIDTSRISKAERSPLGLLITRVGGLFRQIFVAAYFGAGKLSDIYIIGITLTNFLRRIVAENALEKGFLPIFSRLFYRSSRKKTWESATSIVNFTLLILHCRVSIPSITPQMTTSPTTPTSSGQSIDVGSPTVDPRTPRRLLDDPPRSCSPPLF